MWNIISYLSKISLILLLLASPVYGEQELVMNPTTGNLDVIGVSSTDTLDTVCDNGATTDQAAQFAQVKIDGATEYIDTDGAGNMTFTDTNTGTRTLHNIGCPVYLYLDATTQSEGDLHLTDTTWAVDKAIIYTVRIETASTDWDLYILQNDNGYATDDAVFKKYKLMGNWTNGNATIRVMHPYEDEDATQEVHLYWVDNSGTNTCDVFVKGTELI